MPSLTSRRARAFCMQGNEERLRAFYRDARRFWSNTTSSAALSSPAEMTSTVSFPATEPTTSDNVAASIAAATPGAVPGSDLMTTRLLARSTLVTNSETICCRWRSSERTYMPSGSLRRPISVMSRETVACVQRIPRLRSSTTSSPCVLIEVRRMMSRMASCRSFRCLVIGCPQKKSCSFVRNYCIRIAFILISLGLDSFFNHLLSLRLPMQKDGHHSPIC